MLPTVWQALLLKPSLTHLTIRSSSCRSPRPVALVPALPNLKSLKLYDIDPLCYGDDISVLIRDAKNLEDLKLIWNPRMREMCEPSVTLGAFFGPLIAAGKGAPLRKMTLKNLYVLCDTVLAELAGVIPLEEMTFMNSVAGPGDDADTIFFEQTWRAPTPCTTHSLKMLRIDKTSRQQIHYCSTNLGLERLYLVGPLNSGKTNGNSSKLPPPFPISPASSVNSQPSDATMVGLKEDYLDAIIKYQGPTLRHLLLMPYWRLTLDEIALIVSSCPNLEQLGMGFEFDNLLHLRRLMPFLSKLTAIRFLDNADDPTFSEKVKELDENGSYEEKLASLSQDSDWSIKWMGLGDLVFEFGKLEQHVVDSADGPVIVDRRQVRRRPFRAAQHVEIFGMDSSEV